MKRLVLVLALGSVGCGPHAGAVQLLTGDPLGPGACYTNFAEGLLVVQGSGTAIADETAGGSPVTSPVMWRSGFTGRWAGSQIEVMDPTGKVVATTGRRYRLSGGYYQQSFFACGEAVAR